MMSDMFDESFSAQFKNNHTKIDILKVSARRIYDWGESSKSRPYWRIYWSDQASSKVSFDHKDIKLSSEHLVIIPPYLEVKHSLEHSFDLFCIDVDIERPFHVYPEIFSIELKSEEKEIVERIIRNPYDQGFKRQAELQSLMLKVLMSLNSDFFQKSQMTKEIYEVIKYMETHVGDYMSNDILAEMCGMSKNSFIRIFSKENNVTPQEYLKKLRLDASVSFLTETNYSIDKITKLCGFRERNYFSRVFSQKFGIGPVGYRKGKRTLELVS